MKVKSISFVSKIMIAMGLGIAFGVFFKEGATQIKIVGDLFLRLIQMSIPLLVFGQIVEAVAKLNPEDIGSMGRKTVLIFVVSSLAASVWGIMFALIFVPGHQVLIDNPMNVEIGAQSISMMDTIRSFVPTNFMQALSSGNIMQIIVFSILFGMAFSLYRKGEMKSVLLPMLVEFNEIILGLITLVMKLAPIGIFALVASIIGQMGVSVILPLLKYLLVYGLATLTFLLLWILVVSLTCKRNPLKLIGQFIPMSMMALATTSSAITLPLAMQEARTRLGIKEKVTKFVLPLGMTLNSNGSSMHMAITVVTVSQIYGLIYAPEQLFFIAIVATLVSLANAVVPGAGLVSLAIIIPQLGLPIESIAIFAGVEWFVGMLRTILIVTSDVFTALLVDRFETNEGF